jgi:formylglycine-generating enzyme required for sulfatase activity
MKKVIVILFLTVVVLNCGFLQAGFSTNPMDFNNDKKVDILDFSVFVSNWLWEWEAESDPNEFVYIPAGSFEMGDHFSEGNADELPVHAVTLGPFYMSKYEITNQKYCDYLNSVYPGQIKVFEDIVYAADDNSNNYPYCDAPSSPSNGSSQIIYSTGVFSVNIKDGTDMSNHPMVKVSWYGAAAYCNWKSLQEGLEICYDLSAWQYDLTKDGYRLPTEAEWEYAARGGEHNPYYRYAWGDSINGSMANYWTSGDPYETGWQPYTTPVGYYDSGQTPTGANMANGYGLYDMAGDVWEWCNDWYGSSYYGTSETTNPTGPASGSERILRGGGWANDASYCRVAYRNYGTPSYRSSSSGFRVCVFASLPD